MSALIRRFVVMAMLASGGIVNRAAGGENDGASTWRPAFSPAGGATRVALWPSRGKPLEAEVREFLRIHNEARAAVGVPPLLWDTKVAMHSQKWADHLAAIDHLEHRPAPRLYGENIASMAWRGFTPGDAARLWLRERGGYRAGKTTSDWRTGHYTQMVWRTSTEVGCGIARAIDGTIYVVANYSPAGNMVGRSAY